MCNKDGADQPKSGRQFRRCDATRPASSMSNEVNKPKIKSRLLHYMYFENLLTAYDF